MNPSPKTLRILFVTPVSPFSWAAGSEQRSALMLSALTRLGRVDVLQLSHGDFTQVTSENAEGRRVVLAQVGGDRLALSPYRPKLFLTRDIERALGCTMSDFQLIVGRYVWPVCQLAIPDVVPVIVDLDDFRYRYSHESPWSWSSAKQRLTKAITHRLVLRQLKRFDGAFTVSAQDAREVVGLPTALLSNVSVCTCLIPSPVPQSKNILFVGSLWYGPNVDGINWFLAHVWPRVRVNEPEATLTLVGAASQSARARWQIHPGVSAPGFVVNLAAVYEQVNLVVVPIQSGGGTNIKVLEAMAHGRPCLVSSFVAKAFAGLLKAEKEMLVARNKNEFSVEILKALKTPKLLQNVANAGHFAAGKHFAPALFESTAVQFIQTTLLKNARAT